MIQEVAYFTSQLSEFRRMRAELLEHRFEMPENGYDRLLEYLNDLEQMAVQALRKRGHHDVC